MGKKGTKRKTRWRTLSIGALPGGEDEEEGLRNGYVKNQESDGNAHTFDQNGQAAYKPRRTATTGTTGTSGYAGTCSRSRRDGSTESTSQPKIIFNEDEYTRITTPRQDVLFKKSYLSRRKPWAISASTSVTPSTTESQSASHSSADGSESIEDQQVLDGAGEFSAVVEQGPQMGYGTFYDQSSGYFYEYPVMLVGPTPMPTRIAPSVLATMPCDPVPLRPIEWINPAFVPKLSEQPYCMMHYQSKVSDSLNVSYQPGQNPEMASAGTEEHESNNETNGVGSAASCSGSVAEEVEETKERTSEVWEERPEREAGQEQQQAQKPMEEETTRLENDANGQPYFDAIVMQQPVHISHVLPPVHQPYMYPGHYMFGPPLVNVNGVTIQSGPMIRTTDMAAIYAKRRKKKKKRKQKRIVSGNAEDEEEEEYSSECDNGLSSSPVSWCPTVNRPLNPECEEFQLRVGSEDGGGQASTSAEGDLNNHESISNGENASSETLVGKTRDETEGDDLPRTDTNANVNRSDPNIESRGELDEEVERLNHRHVAEQRQDNKDTSNEEKQEKSEDQKETDGEKTSPRTDANETDVGTNVTLGANRRSNEDVESDAKSTMSKGPLESLTNGELDRGWEKEEAKGSKETKSGPRRKYGKGAKIVREATPAPEEVEEKVPETRENGSLTKGELSGAEKKDSSDERVSSEVVSEHKSASETVAEGSNGDSRTRISEYPITEAVTEWLRRGKLRDIFIRMNLKNEEESEEESEEEEEEPPKNLHGNPVPALSANTNAGDLESAENGEFARSIEARSDRQDRTTRENALTKKKRVPRIRGKKSDERIGRKARNGDEEADEKRSKRKGTSSDSGDACEFAENDSVVDTRVAKSSRMDSKRVVARRARKSEKLNRDQPVENVDVKMRLIDDENEEGGAIEDAVTVRTFEKGEIVVSEDGKLLPVSSYEVICENASISQERRSEASSKKIKEDTKIGVQQRRGEDAESEEKEEESNSVVASLTSIEEPDVLECWEVETIEPVITPKRMLQSRGILYKGEAAEEDGYEVETSNMERVQKYYRLARGSVEEEPSEIKNVDLSRTTVPKTPERIIESFCSEETPAIPVIPVPDEGRKEKGKVPSPEEEKIPIDEAFEVYESCYTGGKSQFLRINSNSFKSRSLYGQDGEGPIPCRAVCCNVQ